MTQKTKLPVWYLPGPFYRYEQDVKAEAAKAGVRIIDANATESRDGAAREVPKVTLKPEYRPKGKAEAAKVEDNPPSHGLNVEQLKEALAAKGVTIPEGVTLKADLAALLDAPAA
ncbi:hypothetical protein L532_2323 [Bordetella bronchiseptica OSU095]|uniref:hypothetical protein n=1 Tax=Bordetella bronchiseptica TaxID=518 RepID=UPI0004A0B7AF|nr:hypothetical protein [Bordetella bronchiseptica]KDD44755.1 hypothetical protein L532_2323 [Bordetella bronchiseptica OSU095]